MQFAHRIILAVHFKVGIYVPSSMTTYVSGLWPYLLADLPEHDAIRVHSTMIGQHLSDVLQHTPSTESPAPSIQRICISGDHSHTGVFFDVRKPMLAGLTSECPLFSRLQGLHLTASLPVSLSLYSLPLPFFRPNKEIRCSAASSVSRPSTCGSSYSPSCPCGCDALTLILSTTL